MFRIIHIEDNSGDALLIREAFEILGVEIEIINLWDGQSAINYFSDESNVSPTTHLILVDLNLPVCTGHEVIRTIRQHEQFDTVPIVVFSTSSEQKDFKLAMQLRANAYLVKPSNISELERLTGSIYNFWYQHGV